MAALTNSHGKRSDELEGLFAEWMKSYPETYRGHFHKDGIVHEELYGHEATRVLYVLLEPNNKDGKFNHDLTVLFSEVSSGKPFNRNLARWTAVLLDGTTEYFTPDAECARQQLRRVAIMNLKKLAGSGTANHEAISVQAWRDKDYIRRQVAMIHRLVWHEIVSRSDC